MLSTSIIDQLLFLASLIGVITFAISGALFAAEKQMDILGFILIGTVTAIGGGTLRDLLLGISPVTWVAEPFVIYVCIVVSALTYFTVSFYQKRESWILWMDAVGLAAFAVSGTQAALRFDIDPVIAVVMGVMSATFGGLIRDVLCAEVLTLMKPQLYITCAFAGSVVYVLLFFMEVDINIAVGAAFMVGFLLRAAAIWFDLKLPQFDRF